MFWASRALVRIDSAVAVPAADSVRSTSAASDLTWLRASAEAATSVLWASRAPARTALGGGGAGGGQRPFDVGGQRHDLAGGIVGGGDQRGLRFAGAGDDRLGGLERRRWSGVRSTSAVSVRTCSAASLDASTSAVCASRALFSTDSAVAVPAADSERSTSVDSERTWLATSAEVDTSVVCASRAPASTERGRRCRRPTACARRRRTAT